MNYKVNDPLQLTFTTMTAAGQVKAVDSGLPQYRIYTDPTAAAVVGPSDCAACDRTGQYAVMIDLTVANGFAPGNYSVHVEFTVDGVTSGVDWDFVIDRIGRPDDPYVWEA